MKQNVLAALVAPVFLRMLLAVTFVWAGLGKVMESMDYTGDDAATLSKWGIGDPASAPAAAPPSGTQDAPASKPGAAPSDPKPQDTRSSPPAPPADQEPRAADPDKPADAASAAPASVRAYRLYGIALMISKSSTAVARADGSPGMALVPAKAADGRMPLILAWAATITEIAAGVCVLIGFLTRLAALGLAFTMAVAMWLTQIGPAIASGAGKLGFLPDLPAFDGGWQTLLLQFILLCASLSLLFAGAGMLSLDRLLFFRPTEVVVKPVAAPAA